MTTAAQISKLVSAFVVPSGITLAKSKIDRTLFFEIFEDDIGKAMYNNFSRQADLLCGDEVTGACSDFYYVAPWLMMTVMTLAMTQAPG